MKLTKLEYAAYEEYLIPNSKEIDNFHEEFGGYQYRFRFPNGYGVSVIKHIGSYGYKDDLFELAVLKRDEDGDWSLCYDTEITDDVIGYLNNEEVLDLMERVKNL